MVDKKTESNAADEAVKATVVKHSAIEQSPTKLLLKRFFRSKLSVVGLAIIVFLFLFCFMGPVIYNRWGQTETDASEGSTVFVYEQKPYQGPDGNEYVAYEVYYKTYSQNIYAQPSKDHLLGTDNIGMDIFVRLMYGGRISLTIGLIVVLLETLIGVIMGGLAGYFGKWVDQIIMRLVDIINCLPTLPLLLIASALLNSLGVPENNRIYFLMIILTVIGWAGTARIVRGQFLTLREQEYMIAAEAMGFSSARRIFKHLVPNVMPQLIVSMTLGLGGVILYESTLSYLGLGIMPPYAAWGTMISGAKDIAILTSHFNMWGPPGICIILAVLGFNFIGDGLRDALDPRMKR